MYVSVLMKNGNDTELYYTLIGYYHNPKTGLPMPVFELSKDCKNPRKFTHWRQAEEEAKELSKKSKNIIMAVCHTRDTVFSTFRNGIKDKDQYLGECNRKESLGK